MARSLMRKPPLFSLRPVRSRGLRAPSRLSPASASWLEQHARHLANIRDDRSLNDVWFTGTRSQATDDPLHHEPARGANEHNPPDERTLKLGKTIRILHERLPTLLASPLPQEILSPQISLNLFPSTHPHLPSVSGKIAYSAALWTAPVAWGRVPVVGNVKLLILSERMIKNGINNKSASGKANEELIVKWRTCGKTKRRVGKGTFGQVDKITEFLGGVESLKDGEEDEFTGLFIFSFDEEGRILSHTIEHAQHGGNWEKMTSRVVNVTDWLLGRAKWKRVGDEGLALGYGYCEVGEAELRHSLQQRHAERRDEG